jgi:L-proline amide hydrolase
VPARRSRGSARLPRAARSDGGDRATGHFYDQLGCGNSDHPHDPTLWSVGLFVEELGAVRQALGLDRLHYVGQLLAQEYAPIQPSGLASLVLHSSLASVPQWVSEANRLRSELPAKVRETLLKHEVDGTTDEPAYEEAMMVFYRRHVCRADPWPECVTRAFGKLTEDPEVYHVMNGASEFHVVGVIKDWDITDRLGEISVPTLITSGCYDETTPAIAETLQRAIAGSEWVVFEQSAHLAHAEEPQRYMAVLDAFLSRVEKTGSQVSPSRKPWFL